MLSYLTSTVAFLGAIFGLAGKAWDESRPGRIKLTKRGWTSLIIVITGFGLTLGSTYKSECEHDHQEQQRRSIRRIAYNELAYLCRRVAAPFDEMLSREKQFRFESRFPDEMNRPSLTAPPVVDFLAQIDFLVRPDSDISGIEYDSYADALLANGESMKTKFRQVFLDYNSYLEPEDILLIHEIADHQYLLNMNFIHQNLPWFDDNHRRAEHVQFFTSVEKLWQRVDSGVHFSSQTHK